MTVTVPHMTRFLLNLNEAVDTVFAAIENAEKGETFIPIAPAATVENIAKALVGDKDIEIKITGIRPGEKIHEILISEEEMNHTIKKGNYYAIKSMLPELNGDIINQPNVLGKEYSSGDEVLDLEGTIKLLSKNNLLVVDNSKEVEGELLR